MLLFPRCLQQIRIPAGPTAINYSSRYLGNAGDEAHGFVKPHCSSALFTACFYWDLCARRSFRRTHNFQIWITPVLIFFYLLSPILNTPPPRSRKACVLFFDKENELAATTFNGNTFIGNKCLNWRSGQLRRTRFLYYL